MLSRIGKLPSWKQPTAKEYNALIDRLNILSKISGGKGIDVITGIAGVSIIGREIPTSKQLRIFEVQSAAAGDGIYNCYRQTLDATEWDDVTGVDKFDDFDANLIEVLNLRENDPVAAYTPALALYDRLICWKMIDDEGGGRWIGVPIVQGPRPAKTTADAGGGLTIVCNLILNNGVEAAGGELGLGITVNCAISGGAALNATIPRLENNEIIMVENIQGNWQCSTKFQATEDCGCVSLPLSTVEGGTGATTASAAAVALGVGNTDSVTFSGLNAITHNGSIITHNGSMVMNV